MSLAFTAPGKSFSDFYSHIGDRSPNNPVGENPASGIALDPQYAAGERRAASEAAYAEAEKRRRASQYSSLNPTGARGDTDVPNLAAKQLLGL